MQRDGSDEDAAGDEPGDELGRERAAGARHLGAPGLRRVDVLVGGERPAARHVAVTDRPAVLGEERLDRSRELEARQPEPRC